MRTTKRVIVLGLLVCGLGQAVSVTIMTASASSDGAHVQFETKLEPSGHISQAKGLVGGVMISDGVFHRYMQDGTSRTYYGYDISFEPADEDMILSVNILPLSVDAKGLFLPDPETWKGLSLPRYPKAQKVRLGDTMAFDLLVNQTTGQRIVEYLHFGESHRSETAIGPAREFTIHDVQMEIRAPQFMKNGKVLDGASDAQGFVQGHFVIFYVPPHGRFVLSLVPHPGAGLLRAGEVRGSTLRFQIGEDTYEVNSKGKIVPGSAYDLYVLHESTYRPSDYPDAPFFFGASDAFQGSR